MLTPDEKTLLRQLICAGYFNGTQQVREGFTKLPLTPQILSSIEEKSDEELRDIFQLYKAQKKVELNQKKSSLSSELSKIQAELDK